VVVTPVSEVTETDAICEKVSRTTRMTSEGVVEKVMVSMIDKLKALELDAKLAGELTGGVVHEEPQTPPVLTDEEIDGRMQQILAAMLAMPCGSLALYGPKPVPVPEPPDLEGEMNLKLAYAMAAANSRGKNTPKT
jgi:hypothetical protein